MPNSERSRRLTRIESWLETPMFLLALLWLGLFVLELTRGLTPWQEKLTLGIWVIFLLDFLFRLAIAPQKLTYLKDNWLMLLALIAPALRMLRIFQALRLLQTGQVARGLTSTNYLIRALKEVQGPEPVPEMHVGLLVAESPSADSKALQSFAEQLAADIRPVLEKATGIPWRMHLTGSSRLKEDSATPAADFLDEASLRMVEGPYDLMLTVTDVPVLSDAESVEAGVASPTCRMLILSTRRLLTAPRGEPVRKLASAAVRWNAATLVLHLIGHTLGLRHNRESEVMGYFRFNENRKKAGRFTPAEQKNLHSLAEDLPDHELRRAHWLKSLTFHLLMAMRHPWEVIYPLLHNRALLMPLALPGLATAAFAPTLLLIFTAEIWDAGLGMKNSVAVIYAVISILGATFYLLRVQALLLPHGERQVLTEHLAVTNTVIFLSVLLAMIGLFLMIAGLMLVMELYIFPPDLMKTWPTLDQPGITFADKLRLACFISTIGVTTGALAGGLESRTVIRHLGLFTPRH